MLHIMYNKLHCRTQKVYRSSLQHRMESVSQSAQSASQIAMRYRLFRTLSIDMDRKNRLNTENKSDCLAVHLPLIIGTFFRPHKETGTGIAGFCLQKIGNRNR